MTYTSSIGSSAAMSNLYVDHRNIWQCNSGALDTGASNIILGCSIDGTSCMTGSIAAALMYNRLLTNAEYTQAVDYLLSLSSKSSIHVPPSITSIAGTGASLHMGTAHSSLPFINQVVAWYETSFGLYTINGAVNYWIDAGPYGYSLSSSYNAKVVPNQLNGHPVIKLRPISSNCGYISTNSAATSLPAASGAANAYVDVTVVGLVKYIGITNPWGGLW